MINIGCHYPRYFTALMNACDKKQKYLNLLWGKISMSDKLTTWSVELSGLAGRADARVKLGLRKLAFF